MADIHTAQLRVPRHLVLPERTSGRQAKVDLRIPDAECKRRIGSALQHAVNLAHLSNKEAAAAVGVDDGQFGRWISGSENAQIARVMACEALKKPFLVAFIAEFADASIEIRTVFTVKEER